MCRLLAGHAADRAAGAWSRRAATHRLTLLCRFSDAHADPHPHWSPERLKLYLGHAPAEVGRPIRCGMRHVLLRPARLRRVAMAPHPLRAVLDLAQSDRRDKLPPHQPAKRRFYRFRRPVDAPCAIAGAASAGVDPQAGLLGLPRPSVHNRLRGPRPHYPQLPSLPRHTSGWSWLQLVAAGWSHDGGGWRSQPTPSSPPLSHTDRFRDARPTMDVAGDVHFVASRVHPRNIECCRLQRPATSNPCRLFVLIVILSSCAAAAALASFTCDDAAAVGLKGSWFYTWSMNAAQHTQCPGAAAEFVPMYAHSVPQTSLLTKRKKRLAPGLPLPNGHWNRLLVAGIAQGPCASHCRHQEPVLIRRFSCASPSPVFKIG